MYVPREIKAGEMASVKVYPLRERTGGQLTQSKIEFPCRKRSREDAAKAQLPGTLLTPKTKRAKQGSAMPVTRRSTRASSRRRVSCGLSENEEGPPSGAESQVNGSPSRAAGHASSKGRQRPPLRDQNAEAPNGKEESEEGIKTGAKGKEQPVRSTQRNASSAIHVAKRALHGSIPPTLLCRDEQITVLSDFLQSSITQRKPGALYISGAPGTGKTACLTHILQNSKALLSGATVAMVNCMNVSSPQAIFARLGEELLVGKRGRKEKSVEEALLKAITTSKKMNVVVLDEVDQLDTRSQEVLYTLFEWPSLPGSKLILVGIANSLDLTDRILPRLQSHVSCRPRLLHFAPYSREEIAAILEARLQVEGVVVIEPMAIQFCARKVAAVHGDLRKALDMCRRAIELVETQERCQQSKNPDSNDTPQPIRVTLRHIASVISEVYGSGVTPSNQDAFPLQQKLVVCTLLLMVRGKGVKEVTLGKLHEAYVKVCRHRQLKYESESEFFGLCSMLETRGIVTLRGGREARLTRVGMKLQTSDVEHALQDQVLISSILEHGIPGN